MTAKRKIVALGEVLWDVFPDGAKFGGAPANFACSMAGVGSDLTQVSLVSSVGNDDLGRQAKHELTKRGVDITHVSSQPHPTGQVFIELNDKGEATYEFLANTAWDNIECTSELAQLAQATDVVCFGTLGQREPVACDTIQQFVRRVPQGCLRVFDINLRPPYYCEQVVISSLELANILKLNEDELPYLAQLFEMSGTDEAVIQQLISMHNLDLVAYTRGADGASLFKTNEHSHHPRLDVDVVDTVGAGDAFTAALVRGILESWPLQQIGDFASQAAAWVCSQPGATPENWDLFKSSAK